MVLAGREAQRSAIANLIADARDGRSGVIALVGEPGIGKSALLEYGAELADGMNVLRARGVQSEARIPFAGLSELLRPALAHLDKIPYPQAAALEGALGLVPARAEDRFATGAATLSLLAAHAEEQPLLVVIDDVHWIDGSSADALAFAFRRLIADRVAVLLAARDGEPSLLDDCDLPCVYLEGLDAQACATVLNDAAGPMPCDLIDRLHRHTGGNPLALIEAAGEIEKFRHGAPLDVPLPLVPRVSDVYVARTRALNGPCRTVLLLASASDISELTTIDRAARLLKLDIADLAAAEDAGLVEISSGSIQFRHPLMRSAVYNDATPQQRRQVHRALAAVLPDADPDRRAWHLALAAIGPDDTACSALEQAAVRGRKRSAYEEAFRAFERAGQLSPEEPRQARLLYQAADAAWAAGLPTEANDLLRQAANHAERDDLVIAIEHLRGHIAARLGPVSEGLSILTAAGERALRTDPEVAVVILAEAINAAFYAGDAETMRSAAERIATIEGHLVTDHTRFFATMAQGMALTFSSHTARGAALLRQGVQLAARDINEADDPKWLAWAAMGPLWLREGEMGRSLIDRATDVARSRAAMGVLPYLLGHIAIEHAATDRWSEAEATFHEVLRLTRDTHQRTDRSAALARLAWLEARLGKDQDCMDHADESLRLADSLGLILCKVWALAAMGELHLANGRTAEAIALLEEQESFLRLAGIADVDLSPAPELVELYLRQGVADRAATLAADYQREATEKGQPWALARAARSRGLLVPENEIDDVFSESLAAHHRTPDLFETARTYLAYGSRLRRSRQRIRARQQLQNAIDIFDSLGAKPWTTIARGELAATGVRARQRNESTRTQLTPQEFQIALLLAEKHTTKQAAAALFLSPKTVEYHLRNVYRKLGCNTREELAIALEAAPVQVLAADS